MTYKIYLLNQLFLSVTHKNVKQKQIILNKEVIHYMDLYIYI